MDGYIKLWRKSIDKGWLKNHKLWTFWTYCLMMAAGIEGRKLKKYSQIALKRGQFIFGLKRASEDTGLTYQNIRTCIAKLERWGNINKQSNNQFSIITILKYDSYNPLKEKSNKQTNLSLTNKQQTTNKRTNNNKEGIKESKEGKGILARPKADPRVSEVFNYWNEKYKALTGEKYLFAGAKEGALIKRILATYDKNKTLDFIDFFFKEADKNPNCWWADKLGIGTFSSCVPKIIRQITGGVKNG